VQKKLKNARAFVRRSVEWQKVRSYQRLQEDSFSRELRTILSYFLVIISVLLTGCLGYVYFEGWSFFDSLYMTVITLASVGYMEVHPLTKSGRAFTIFLIVLGFGLFTVLYTTLAQKLLQRQFLSAYRGKRMQEVIRSLSSHTIFCGYGRLTRIAAAELRRSDNKLIIIELDPQRVADAREAGYLVVEGDATVDEVLIQAGVKRAKRLVSVLQKDSDNLYVVLTSRELSPDLFILSRTEDEAGDKRLRRAGADRLISPYRVGGQKIAEGLLRPYVTDFIDLAVSSHQGHLQIEEIKIPEQSSLNGLSLKEAALRQRVNVMVAAVISKDGEMNFNPAAETVIEGGTTFIALGLKGDLLKLESILLEGETSGRPKV
jgi:voltage-gated potassium channel